MEPQLASIQIGVSSTDKKIKYNEIGSILNSTGTQ